MLEGCTPFFDGSDESDLVQEIFYQIGAPTEESWPGVTTMLVGEYSAPIETRAPDINGSLYDLPLIRGLFTLNPATRISALTALSNEYFNEIRSYVEDKYPAPAIYVPTCDEILCLRCEIPNPVKMKEITARCRRNMLNWLHDIGILLKIQTRTYYLALHYVDKYLSLTPDLPFKKYKAVCAGAMSLACDLDEIVPPDLNEFSQMTNNHTPQKNWVT